MKLGDLVTVTKGKKPSTIRDAPQDGDARLLQIEDLRPAAVPRYAPRVAGHPVAEADDVVIAWDGANAGTSHYGVSGLAGSTLAILRPRDASVVHTPFLGHFLKSRQDYLRSTCKGATVPHLDPQALSSLDLALPPLDEQRRIAAILDKADSLLAMRRASGEAGGSLERSIFASTFGDPIRNPQCLPVTRLGELGLLDRGVSRHRPRNDPSLLGGPYPLVQTGDVANSGGYITSYSSTYSEAGLAQSRLWPAGTLCITIAANIAKPRPTDDLGG